MAPLVHRRSQLLEELVQIDLPVVRRIELPEELLDFVDIARDDVQRFHRRMEFFERDPTGAI